MCDNQKELLVLVSTEYHFLTFSLDLSILL